jgi:hypothetical protein
MTGPWLIAAYVWAVGMAALALGLVIGWRACVRSAENDWEDDWEDDWEGDEEPPPLVAPVYSLAAALPGPPPQGVRLPEPAEPGEPGEAPSWQETAIAQGLTLARAERWHQYHRLFTAELYEGNEEIANEICWRVLNEYRP